LNPDPSPKIDPERERALRDLLESWNRKVHAGADLPSAVLCSDERIAQGPFWEKALDRTDSMWLLADPNLSSNLSGADFTRADLKDVAFTPDLGGSAMLQCCDWAGAQLDRSTLEGADLRSGKFRRTSLRGTDLSYCWLGGADLRNSQMDSGTDLAFTNFGDQDKCYAQLVDVGWNGASLAQIDWKLATFRTHEDVQADVYQRVIREAARARLHAKRQRLLRSIARRVWHALQIIPRLTRENTRLRVILRRTFKPFRRPFRSVAGLIQERAIWRRGFLIMNPFISAITSPAIFIRSWAVSRRLALQQAPRYRVFTMEQIELMEQGIGFKALYEMGAQAGPDGGIDNHAFVAMLSDSQEHGPEADGELRTRAGHVFDDAVRVNTQLATELRRQGLGPEADHFAFEARLAQQRVWRLSRDWRRALANRTLRSLCGYGFRPSLLLWWYVAVNAAAVVAYLIVDRTKYRHPSVLDAITLSLTAFHGRGFVAYGFSNLTSPAVAIAACEAVIGLFIEATFVGTFVQRVLT
jgi:hypothetical protein